MMHVMLQDKGLPIQPIIMEYSLVCLPVSHLVITS